MKYDQYISYRDSWIKLLPYHWKFKRIKDVFVERKEKNKPIKTNQILSLTNTKGVIPYNEKGNIGNKAKENLEDYMLAYPNDIVLNSMNIIIGSVGLSKYFGAVSPVYYMLYMRNKNNVRFFDYVFRNYYFQKSLKGLGNGILEIRMRIPMKKLNNIYIPVPPQEEQDQIVRYLDWQVSKINKLIAAKKHEISVLEEERQSLIDTFVLRSSQGGETKGCNLSWNTPIPITWNVYKFNQVFDFGKGLAITKANLLPSGVPVISYGQVHSKTNTGTSINNSLIRYVSEKFIQSTPSALVQEGDFIFADTSEDYQGVGNCVYVDRNDTLFAGYHTVIAHPKDNQKRRYLAYLFLSSAWRYSLRKQVNGVKVYSITQRILKNTCVILPSQEEQDEIVHILDVQCNRIDALINAIRGEIEHLHELRTRLISEVVTGQIDVRNIEVPDFETVEEAEDNEDVIEEKIESSEVADE